MLLGRVVGMVVATRKDEKLEGLRLMIVRQMDIEAHDGTGYVIAVDAVGAGVGEVVLYATGSSARQTIATDKRPCDAVIMAVVDTWEIGGQVKFTKE